MSDIYKVIVKKDNDGELYIDLPDELMKSLDWKIGDEFRRRSRVSSRICL